MKKTTKKSTKKTTKKAVKKSEKGKVIFKVTMYKDTLGFKVDCSRPEMEAIAKEIMTMLLTGKPSC